jgi:hypothetical protein
MSLIRYKILWYIPQTMKRKMYMNNIVKIATLATLVTLAACSEAVVEQPAADAVEQPAADAVEQPTADSVVEQLAAETTEEEQEV